MSDAFHIHHFGEQLGPWSKEQVIDKIKAKEIHITDYIFDDEFNEWVLICESTHFSDFFKSYNNELSSNNSKSSSVEGGAVRIQNSSNQQSSDQNSGSDKNSVQEFLDPQVPEQAWYILKNENKFGPYSYLNLVKMLQGKQLMEYDFIYKDGMSKWKTVSEVEEFSADKIRELKNSGQLEINEVFFRRRYLRVEYGASIIIHNNQSVWKGKSLDISPGGAGLLLEKIKISESDTSKENSKENNSNKKNNEVVNNSVKTSNGISDNIGVGQNLFLLFKAGDGVPPFNAVCTVVSVNHTSDQHLKLGVKFTNIKQNVQQSIKTMSDSLVKKTAA
jgi:hypothetical protein